MAIGGGPALLCAAVLFSASGLVATTLSALGFPGVRGLRAPEDSADTIAA